MLDAILGVIGTLLYPLFSIIFVALNGIQNVFYAFAGIGPIDTMDITVINDGTENGTGLIFYMLNQPIVKNMMLSIALLGLFLVIIFTVMAFIKNAYAAKQKGWKEIVGNAIKGLANFVFIPVVCLFGVWIGNILLIAINGATSTGGTTDISRTLFTACAFNANKFRTGEAGAEDIQELKDFAKSYGYEVAISDDLTNEEYANIVDDLYGGYGVSIYEQITVSRWYSLWSINYLILIVGGIFMLYAFGSMAFGMVRRLLMLIVLYIISPAICAMYPLDEGKAVGQWKDKFIKEFLSVYGSIAGINIFFAVLPLMQGIQIFAGGEWNLTNSLFQVFIVAGCLMVVKEVTGMISGFVGAEDALSKSSGQLGATAKKIGKTALGISQFATNAVIRKRAGQGFFSQAKEGILKKTGLDAFDRDHRRKLTEETEEKMEKGAQYREEREFRDTFRSDRKKYLKEQKAMKKMTEEERANYQPQYADPLATPQGQIDYIKGATKRGASEREVISELSRMTGKNPLELKKEYDTYKKQQEEQKSREETYITRHGEDIAKNLQTGLIQITGARVEMNDAQTQLNLKQDSYDTHMNSLGREKWIKRIEESTALSPKQKQEYISAMQRGERIEDIPKFGSGVHGGSAVRDALFHYNKAVEASAAEMSALVAAQTTLREKQQAEASAVQSLVSQLTSLAAAVPSMAKEISAFGDLTKKSSSELEEFIKSLVSKLD